MWRGNFETEKGWLIIKYMDSLPWAVPKRLNQSRCHLGHGLRWAPRKHVLDAVQIPTRERAIFRGKIGRPRIWLTVNIFKATQQGAVPDGADANLGVLDGLHIAATWRINTTIKFKTVCDWVTEVGALYGRLSCGRRGAWLKWACTAAGAAWRVWSTGWHCTENYCSLDWGFWLGAF